VSDAGVLAGLMVLLVMGTMASNGWDVVEMRNREVWWWTCLMGLTALLMPNPYAGLLMAVNVVGLFQVGRLWYVLRSALIPMAGVGASYALISPKMALWMIPYLLWTGAAVGCALGVWAAIGMYVVSRRPYRFVVPQSWFGMWGVYEDLKHDPYLCGQSNRTHTLAFSALAQACCIGLMWLGQWWAIFAWVLCYLPHHANTLLEKWHHPNIGHVGWLAVVFGLLLLLADPTVAAISAAAGLLLVGKLTWDARGAWQTHTVKELKDQYQWNDKPWWQVIKGNPGEPWFDSGRLAYWRDVIKMVWWPRGPKAWLFGFGTCTWFAKTVRMGDALHPHVFTSAHNEYFHQLIEHGLIGLGVLLLYIGDALWRNFHGMPPQQAVFLVGLTWAGIAAVHFPATFMHEYHPPNEQKEHWFGSPSMNVWTFIIALMAEAR